MAEALILGSMMVGQATAFAPNYNKAVIAAARIFKLLDRQPVIDSEGTKGVKLVRYIASVFSIAYKNLKDNFDAVMIHICFLITCILYYILNQGPRPYGCFFRGQCLPFPFGWATTQKVVKTKMP